MKKKLILTGLTVFTIFIGFLRDAVFVPMNASIERGDDPLGRLALIKWVLTAFFTLLYMAITAGYLFVIFRSNKYIRISVAVYAFLLSVSFIISLAGYVFFSFQEVYPFVRTIMGIVQSPILSMVLIAACLINDIYRVSN